MSDEASELSEFPGTVRLFPLPNLVLFPHVVQPLHIFEPRYRRMTADALAGDRLIAMMLLQPGWEADYDGRPAIYPVGCVGKIIADQLLDDGRYNLLLRGLARVRVLHEEPPARLYRTARVEVLNDVPPSPAADRDLRRRLKAAALPWFDGQAKALQQFHLLMQNEVPLGVLGDLLTFSLPLLPEIKQELLADADVGRRVGRLVCCLEKKAGPAGADDPARKFPPDFSTN